MPDDQTVTTAVPRKCSACGRLIIVTAYVDNDGRQYCSVEHLTEFGELDDVTGKSTGGRPFNKDNGGPR